MLPKEIISVQHPIVKHAVKLREDRKYRKENKAALIAGNKLVQEIGAHSPLQVLFVEKGVKLEVEAPEIYFVSKAILKKITALENPEPVAAIAALPSLGDLKGKKRILALDGVSDPGNVGTLLRSALALGWDGAFLLPGTCDPFNEKAIRAAKGASFRLPIQEGSVGELEELIKKNQCKVYSAEIEGRPIKEEMGSERLVLLLGNESQGIRTSFNEKTIPLCIPMEGQMQSLNVAIAGAILMHHLKGSQ
jgi:TrmH family RNA methyltransferase